MLPKGEKLVGCRWVLIIKHQSNGSIERYKAIWIAQGHTQTYVVDNSQTCTPVAKTTTNNWVLKQFDMMNALVHGNLDEEFLMRILPGFNQGVNPILACKLKKAQHGLKQPPTAWFG